MPTFRWKTCDLLAEVSATADEKGLGQVLNARLGSGPALLVIDLITLYHPAGAKVFSLPAARQEGADRFHLTGSDGAPRGARSVSERAERRTVGIQGLLPAQHSCERHVLAVRAQCAARA